MGRPVTERSLYRYFHDELGRAAHRNGHQPLDATLWYLTDLLTRFSRSDQFFDNRSSRSGLKPLALLYGDAMHAPSEAERNRILQRLGDVALFVAGLYRQSLDRRAVRTEYVVTMGGGAYAFLAENASTDLGIFDELAQHFVRFVNILTDLVHANRERFDASDILRLYALWNETGNPQAEKQLRSLGISLDGAQQLH
ncbi:MAG: hypothetical protein QNJ40_11790 [Xanthomonadales bacterium]|nr:hypothetical protein [Xanthomonadales bacterium]